MTLGSMHNASCCVHFTCFLRDACACICVSKYLPLAEALSSLFLRLHEGLALGDFDSAKEELLAKASIGWPVENACSSLLPSCMRAVREMDVGHARRVARTPQRWSDTSAIRFADSLAIVENDIVLPLLNDLERRVLADPKRYRKLAKRLTTEVEKHMVGSYRFCDFLCCSYRRG